MWIVGGSRGDNVNLNLRKLRTHMCNNSSYSSFAYTLYTATLILLHMCKILNLFLVYIQNKGGKKTSDCI